MPISPMLCRAIRLLIKNPQRFLLKSRKFILSIYLRKVSVLPAYNDWLSQRIVDRDIDYLNPATPVSFSILTTIYEKTDAKLLQETVESLLSQSFQFHEWIMLAHGPVSDDVNKLLSQLEQHSNIIVHRKPQNLGIMGGMKFCIERANGDYIVPMDADDLLTQDALQVMASVIVRSANPAILYSDEDMLINGKFISPYLRPDWDPILNLASSYIWHLCVFRRDIALQLQVYTDMDSNWCHDWDTIFRFSSAGYIPLHVPEVLYHWRQHSASSTNRVNPDSGSMKSTRHLLEWKIALQKNPEFYVVEPFPIFRGTQEWHIKRCPFQGIRMDIIILVSNLERCLRTLQSVLKDTTYPFGSIIFCLPSDYSEKLRAKFEIELINFINENGTTVDKINIQFVSSNKLDGVKKAVSKATAPLILFCSDEIEVGSEEWSWEALKMMELFDDLVMVGGRILKNNRIISGVGVFKENGSLVYSDIGQLASDSGYFSLSLKPHTVNTIPLNFFVANREFLTSKLMIMPDSVKLSKLPMWLGAAAIEQKLRVGFSPLLSVTVINNNDELSIKNDMGLEDEQFLHLYGNIVKNQQWSYSHFIQYKNVCQLM